jgi:hypothetical protein
MLTEVNREGVAQVARTASIMVGERVLSLE